MSITIRKEHGAPTTNTVGFIGEIYEDINTGDRYECSSIYKSTGSKMHGVDCDYHWEKIDMVEEKRLPSGIGGGASSWNDLEDKPFEDNSIVYYERRDGYEPLETFDDEGIMMYKVSDTPLSADELCDTVVVCYSENYGDETLKITTSDIYGDDAFCEACDGMIVSVLEANDDIPYGRGLWVAGEGTAYVSKFYKESIKKIEPKFLSNVVKLHNDGYRLFYDKEGTKGVTKNELHEMIKNNFIVYICNGTEYFLPHSYSFNTGFDYARVLCLDIDGETRFYYTSEHEPK